LPDRPSGFESFIYPALGVPAGAFLAYILIHVTFIPLAWYRQRNEAWAELDAIPGSPASPITPQTQVFINVPEGEMPQSAGADLAVPVNLVATNHVKVEQMDLEVADKIAPSSWESDWVNVGVTTESMVHFTLPAGINPGEHMAKIIVHADTRTWASNFIPVLITSDTHEAGHVQLKPK
jgi:hypothetical protein